MSVELLEKMTIYFRQLYNIFLAQEKPDCTSLLSHHTRTLMAGAGCLTADVSALKLSMQVCLSLYFNDHFPGGPGLTGTRMSPFWIILELRVMGSGGNNRSSKDVQCSSQNVIIDKPTPSFLTGQKPFLSPNQHCQSTEGKAGLSVSVCL